MTMIEMKPQQKWLFDHALYLFMGGLGGASYVLGGIAGFLGPEWEPVARIGVGIAFPAVLIGLVALSLGLGAPLKSVYAWRRPNTSWIARGVMFLTIFIVISFIHFAFWIWPWQTLANAAGTRGFLAVIGIIAGFLVMTYTGFLLGASRPIAFWSTGILPMVFLVSALTSGVLAIILVGAWGGSIAGGVLLDLEYFAVMLIIIEAFAILFHMQATHRVPEGKVAANILMRESGAVLFWAGVVFVGMVIPLILLIVNASALASGSSQGGGALAVLAGLTGLFGNLMLRQAVLRGGVFARLKAGRFEYVVTNP